MQLASRVFGHSEYIPSKNICDGKNHSCNINSNFTDVVQLYSLNIPLTSNKIFVKAKIENKIEEHIFAKTEFIARF